MNNKKRRALSLLLVLFFLGSAFWGCTTGDGQTRILVFSKTKGYRHASIPAGVEAIKALGEKHQFRVDHTEDASVFESDSLKQYDALVFLSSTGDLFNQSQQAGLKQYIQAGGGLVGIHAAADAEYDWPWYGKLVGAYFESHPKVQEATLVVADTNHPSTVFLLDQWNRTDEWYNYKNINPDIHVLLKLDESSYEGGKNGENHPAAWYHEYDGGRVFYTGGGHTDESFSEPLFVDHIWGGLQYVLDEIPNNKQELQ